MKLRQQSSTSYPITFLMVDSTDHVTGKTGLTPTVTISKNGAAFGSPAGAVTEIGNGWYALAGNATDRAALGDLLVHATGTAADPVDDRYCIVPWDPFDVYALGLTSLTNLDTSEVTVTVSNNAGVLTAYRGVTFSATVSGLTISASWTKVYFTAKTDLDLADTASTIQVVETNPGAGTDGLLYLNAAAPVNPITLSDASLTVDQGAGTVVIALTDNLTAQLARGARLHWDLKQIVSGTSSGILASGTMDIELTPTRTI